MSDYKTYRDFGASGDGITCDYAAIKAAHRYANENRIKIKGDPGTTYYISPESFTEAIEIETDVDFCGAAFIIDDRGEAAFEHRELPLFSIKRKKDAVILDEKILSKIAKEHGLSALSLSSGSEAKLDRLTPYLQGKSMVTVINSEHKDYIRYGGNQNLGRDRHEVLLVDKDGSIDESTPVFFDYEKITKLIIHKTNDEPITVENGIFYTVCARAELVGRGGITEYLPYTRGISIKSSNVNIKNITHRIADQPEVISDKSDKNGSYPYGGFIAIRDSYNITLKDCEFAGHVTYYEKKNATSTMNEGKRYNYIAAGSYDFIIGDSCNIKFAGATQKNIPYTMDEKTHNITVRAEGETICEKNFFGIGDTKYWGVMCSSFVRNLLFDKCIISRIDAHEGFFNIDVKDTVIGHTFHTIGGGHMRLDNMTRLAGQCYIIARGDYGASFKGTLTVKNGKLMGYRSYNSSPWFDGPHSFEEASVGYSQGFILNTDYRNDDPEGSYWNWDFGYDCHMPEKITLIGNFESKIPNIYISAKDYHRYYTEFVPVQNSNYRPYALTKEIIYEDWCGERPVINRNYDIMGDNDYMFSQIKFSKK